MPESIRIFNTSISIYYLFWFTGLLLAFAIGIILRKKFDLSITKVVLYISYDIGIGFMLMLGMSWLCGGGKLNGINLVRAIYLCGIYFYLLARLFRDPPGKVSDLLTIKGAFFFGFVKIGCIFPGCCQGYPSRWGIYSNLSQAICFPVQLVEAAILLLIGFILLWMLCKQLAPGQLYAYFLLMFGPTRFLCEFLRDNKKLWFNISELAVHALIATIVGIALIAVNQKKRNNDYEKKHSQN